MINKRYANDGKPSLKINSVQQNQLEIIKTRIMEGAYEFAKFACPICGEADSDKLSSKDRYGLYAPIVICKNCGLIRADPCMTEDSYIHFYKHVYRQLYVGVKAPDNAYFEKAERAGAVTCNFLSNHMSVAGKRVLDVGCGSGALLKCLQNKGASVKGIDLGEEYLVYAIERYGIDLTNTDLFNLPNNHEFDLIIYSDVLEHIKNPISHLEKIKGLLSPRGTLYIKVPSTKNIMRPYLGDFLKSIQNAHVCYYSLATLRSLVEGCGYHMDVGNEKIRSLWSVSKETPKQIVNDYAPAMDYIRSLEKKKLLRVFLPVAYKIIKELKI